jgi:hypothetical protein
MAPPGAEMVLGPFMDIALPVLDDLTSALLEGRPPMPLPILVTPAAAHHVEQPRQPPQPLLQARTERLARQVRMLHDAVDRWIGNADQAGEATRIAS